MENYLVLGIIVGSFGLDGTLKVLSKTHFSFERYKNGNTIFLKCDQEYIPLTVEGFRKNGEIDFVKCQQITSKEEADKLKGKEICIPTSEKIIKEGYYYFDDLQNCKIIDENGIELGIVKSVEEFPAQLTLRVSRKNNNDFFVPFIKEFIVDVDIIKKEIIIKVIEGML